MKRNNYILRVRMDKKEAAHFASITPLIHLSLSDADSNFVAKLLGYSTAKALLTVGFKDNPFLRNAFVVLAFLIISKSNTEVFDDFFDRLVFTDKDVEKRVKSAFPLKKDKNSMSKLELELMWLLQTDKDELDNADL